MDYIGTNDELEMVLRQELSRAQDEPDNEKRKVIIDNAMNLYRVYLEDKKTDWDIDEGRQKVISEQEKAEADREDAKKARLFDGALSVGKTVFEVGAPLAFYGYWMKQGFHFEETGRICSDTFRGLIKWFKPTRK